MQKLIQLYKEWKGAEPTSIEKPPMAGSNRQYYRLFDENGESIVGVVGTSRD